MSQKSSLPQAAKAVSHVLMSDSLTRRQVGRNASPPMDATNTTSALGIAIRAQLLQTCVGTISQPSRSKTWLTARSNNSR
jgi:hypothetical protein